MSSYIVSLHNIGRPFYSEVAMFCVGVNQVGKEADVYKEVFSQIVGILSNTNDNFLYNLNMVPHWSTILFSEIDLMYNPAVVRFREAVRIAAVQLKAEVDACGVIEASGDDSVYLMVSVTMETLVFTIYHNAVYQDTISSH